MVLYITNAIKFKSRISLGLSKFGSGIFVKFQ